MRWLLPLFVISAANFAFAAVISPSYDVAKVKDVGNIDITITTNGTPAFVIPVQLMKVNGQLPTRAQVAMQINAALNMFLNGSAKIVNNTTVVLNPLFANGKQLNTGFSFVTNDLIDATLDKGDFAAAGGNEAGDLALGPNPTTGQDTLATDTVVSAGFTSGLAPVTFTALAGESIDLLTLQLLSALQGGGYTVTPLNSRTIEVFSNGSTAPTELIFSLSPTGTVGSAGIDFGVTSIPEPGAVTLLILGVACLLSIARSRRVQLR